MMLSCKLQQYLFSIPLLPRIAVSACAYFAIAPSFVGRALSPPQQQQQQREGPSSMRL